MFALDVRQGTVLRKTTVRVKNETSAQLP